jgi:hypothetical protein
MKWIKNDVITMNVFSIMVRYIVLWVIFYGQINLHNFDEPIITVNRVIIAIIMFFIPFFLYRSFYISYNFTSLVFRDILNDQIL